MNVLSLSFFPAVFLYQELLLRWFGRLPLADYHVALIAGFSAVYGLVVWLLLSLLRSVRARTVAAGAILLLSAAVTATEYTVYGFFRTFFDWHTMLTMSSDVLSQFAADTVAAITGALPMILLSLLPLCIFWMLRWAVLSPMTGLRPYRMSVLAVAVLLDILLIVPMVMGSTLRTDRDALLYDFTAAGAVPRFGAATTLRMETTYALTGTPVDFLAVPEAVPEVTPTPTPTVYGYNVTSIDFAALAEGEPNKTLKAMHSYFGSLPPTQQNEYTGMFAGKNLVYLVCEAFCPYVIDPERTPTLYKLSTEGFVFTDFYQPDWTMSTSGGEFAAVSGLVPTWTGSGNSFRASIGKAMPYALGHQFRALGYVTAAYHDHSAEYYSRNKTHPNLGYDFRAVHMGLQLSMGWPGSDAEMLEVTMPEHIDRYVQEGTPFHVYYMTVSGHANYNFAGNRQAKKHKGEVAELDYSDPVRAYLACQLEVEYALTWLLEALEEAGIADDTVIALTADHYPYALTKSESRDYYPELSGIKDTERDLSRFRNSFLLWSSAMTEPVVVSDPASTIDILPTLSNLFGLTYDSRLYSGRDLLSENYDVTDPNSRLPMVVFPDNGTGHSWISPVGEYNGMKGKFTPNPGFEAYAEDEAYLDAMYQKAKDMFKNAKRIIEKDYYRELGLEH